jgi:N-acetylmuramoyl-L-alanine amidase
MVIRSRSIGTLALLTAVLAASLQTAVARVAHRQPAQVLPPHGVEIRDVQVTSSSDRTRVVLDLSASAQHTVSVLKHPDRLVLDVAGARLAPAARAMSGAGAVTQMRVGRRPSGELRLVFDLSRQMRARSSVSDVSTRAGRRLVIELSSAPETESPMVEARTKEAPAREKGAKEMSAKEMSAREMSAREMSAREITAREVPASEMHAKEEPVKVEHARPDARTLVVAIDAGHGGEDPGAIGKFGTQEKDVTLAIARALALRVNSEPGMRAVLTRDGDYFVPLRDRMRRARARQADLFVSIHADSIRDRSVDGSSVYILSPRGATDEASRWLAERQNASDLVGGVSLEDKGDVLASVLLDLSQSASLSASQSAAEHVLHQLNRVGEIRRPQVQQARFVVLKSPDIPSMLVETAYISNPQEELRLRGAVHQCKLASAIHQGLRTYFYDDPPAGSRIAELAEAGVAARASVPAARPVLATAQGDSGG